MTNDRMSPLSHLPRPEPSRCPGRGALQPGLLATALASADPAELRGNGPEAGPHQPSRRRQGDGDREEPGSQETPRPS